MGLSNLGVSRPVWWSASIVAVMFVAACGGQPGPVANPPEVSAAGPAEPASPTGDGGPALSDLPSTDDPPRGWGSAEDPLDIGDPFLMGDWEVVVRSVTWDGTEEVMAANQFNAPPAPGRQFVLVEVEATYRGDSSDLPSGLEFAIRTTSGLMLHWGADDYCGVIPTSLATQGEQFPGGAVTGNVCKSVPSDEIAGAHLIALPQSWVPSEIEGVYIALD